MGKAPQWLCIIILGVPLCLSIFIFSAIKTWNFIFWVFNNETNTWFKYRAVELTLCWKLRNLISSGSQGPLCHPCVSFNHIPYTRNTSLDPKFCLCLQLPTSCLHYSNSHHSFCGSDSPRPPWPTVPESVILPLWHGQVIRTPQREHKSPQHVDMAWNQVNTLSSSCFCLLLCRVCILSSFPRESRWSLDFKWLGKRKTSTK